MRKYNIVQTLTLANTQYEVTLPEGAVSYTIKARSLGGTKYDFRVAGVTGKVAGSTEPYELVEAGDIMWEGPTFDVGGMSLFLASSQAGLVVQVSGLTTKAA